MGSIFRMWCLALILLLLCSHSWGACTKWTYSGTSMTDYRTAYCRGSDLIVPISVNCTGSNNCGGTCPNKFTLTAGGNSNRGICSGLSVSITQYSGCYYSLPYFLTNIEYYECDTQAEADSVKCVLNPTAQGCSNCKAADSTWYNNAVDSCNAVYGENNYSIVDTNDVCEHRGHCCSKDSTIAGNACTWKCESVASQCQPPLNFYSGILLDTTVSDTGDVVQGRCYYNCINYVPSDTTKAMVSGNILLAGPVTAMSQGTKVPNAFNSVRITDNDTYIYDYLFPQAEHYVDSIVFTPCVKSLYRGILNGKYVYWYDGQTAPAGVTIIVKVK